MKKNYKFIVTSLLAICFISASYAQQTNNQTHIKGKITAGGKPAEAATISLLKSADSSVVKRTVTDKEGVFDIDNATPGQYILSTEYVGYKINYINIEAGDKDVAVPDIQLSEKAQLSAVTVSTKKPFIENKIDRTVVNVDASPTNTGLTAMELLQKTPGVTVDKDGNVSLRGKQGVLILIDGKPTYLSGQDLATYLKNLPGASLDQIEVMTNPPAKYDASGNSGIINFKTKKNKVKGFNGSVTIGGGMGIEPKANESVNLNYRSGKFNVFGNYSYNWNKGFQDLELTRKFVDSNGNLSSIFRQQSDMHPNYQTHNFKLGADYYATSKTTLGFVVNGYTNPGTFSLTNTSNLYDADNVFRNQTLSANNNTDSWKNIGTNLNIRHKIDTLGSEITGDLDYIHYKSSSDQHFNNYFYDDKGNVLQPDEILRGDLPGQIDIYSAKTDYSKPLKGNAKLEAGLKTSYVVTDNDANYFNLIDNNWVVDTGRTNHFRYKENINAAYVNVSKQLSKKWSAQAGLRLENTNANGVQLTTGESFNRHYTQLFPTAFVSYTMNDKNTFSLNYGRRIQRPDYGDLNPFYYFLDKYTYQVGNPYLKPQFSHNIELNHSYNNFLNTSLSYTAINDVFQQVLRQVDSTTTTYISNSNIAQQRSVALSVSAGFPVTKWWNANIYMQGSYNRYKGFVNNGFIDFAGPNFMTNIQNQFSLPKGWGFELSGFYRTRSVEGIFVSLPMGVINFGASKSVLKNKGTIKLNINDFADLQAFRGYSKYQNIDVDVKNQWDNRVVNISFTYRFNKGQVGQQRRSGSTDDEQSRVKGGRGK